MKSWFASAPQWLIAKYTGAGRYELTEAIFLRLLGLIYLISFASFWPQIVVLAGAHGIAPMSRTFEVLRPQGLRAYFGVPTLFWFDASDVALRSACVAGCLAGLLMVGGIFTRAAAAVCWILYLSLSTAGEPFTSFQWDALLLECGFLALFAGAPMVAYAYRFLLFRLMFESGLVKILSGDPNWRNLHALRFHFLTQPLPNPVAYYVFQAPLWLLDAMTAATLGIELLVPFLLFGPKVLRRTAALCFMLLQVLILLTGNYAFFNLLTLALCFWALDDSTFTPLAGILRRAVLTLENVRLRWAANGVVSALILLAFVQLWGLFAPSLVRFAEPLTAALSPFQVVNNYGLFAVMTTSRAELVLEGSDDGITWREYEFRYKPGALHRALPVVAPYQPRLDWQMWFAALGNYQENPWIGGLLYRLLTGDPAVQALLEPSPFSHPPRYLRILAYDYRFTDSAERARTGAVWTRRFLGNWFGPVSLQK